MALVRVYFLLALVSFVWFVNPVFSQAQYRVNSIYEDTVRVGVVYNTIIGPCATKTTGITDCNGGTNEGKGLAHIEDSMVAYVLKALDTSRVTNVKVSPADAAFGWGVVNSWFPGKLPHVIVHINAGWNKCRGPGLIEVLDSAASLAIGIVEYGNDAAGVIDILFGFSQPENIMAPMSSAQPGDVDTLWMKLLSDTLSEPGVVRNAVDSILGGNTEIPFKKYGVQGGRCTADADVYDVALGFENQVLQLGTQNGTKNGVNKSVPNGAKYDQYNIVTVFEDSVRRGVALAFEPHFLENRPAIEQITYDAIMFASYAHLIFDSVATPVVNAIPAGQKNFNAFLNYTISSATAGAVIHYTLDGSEPTTADLIYNGSILSTTSDIRIRAIATAGGYLNSSKLDTSFNRNATNSVITILDQNGDAYANNIMPGDQTKYTLRLFTNYYENGNTTPEIVSQSLTDSVEITFSLSDTSASLNGSFARMYTKNNLDVSIAISKTSNDNILQAKNFDTLIVTWINPVDPSDVARDTIYVQPAKVKSEVYFSISASLSDTTSAFTENASPVYVIVTDQTAHPDSTYSVLVTSNGGESQTVILSSSGGNLVGQLNAAYDPIVQNDGDYDALLSSSVLRADYTDPLHPADMSFANASYPAKTVITPIPLPAAGSFFQTDTAITLTSTPGAIIRYTIDGSTPSHTTGIVYSVAIPIDSSITLRAIAYFVHDVNTNFVVSSVLVADYNLRDTVATPYAVPTTTYYTEDTTVLLVPADSAHKIYYTINGSTPDSTTSSLYNYGGSGIAISGGTVTVKFYATNGNSVPSVVVTEVYTKRDTLAPVVFTPASTNFMTDTTVALSHPVGGTVIYYTVDGSTPTITSLQYTIPIDVSSPTVIKAIAVNNPAWVQSPVRTETYTPILTVTANPTSQSFSSSVIVSLTSNNGSAAIYYTLDGTNPASSVTGSTLLYGGDLTIDSTTTVKAIAVLASWKTSDILSETYTRTSTPSSLKILDVDGVAFPGDIMPGDQTKYRVQISTNYSGSGSLSPSASTIVGGDSETLTLDSLSTNPSAWAKTFEKRFNFSIAAATGSNGTLEASVYDTVIVTWTNPFDNSDVVADTVYVQSVDVPATVYFSNTSGGVATATYAEDKTPVYIVVNDQTIYTDKTYQVVLTTVTGETETVTLTPSGSTKLIAQLPANYQVTATNDGTLQVRLQGEQITATYTDPIYTTDVAQGVVTYAPQSINAPVVDPGDNTFFQDDTTFTITKDTAGGTIRYSYSGNIDSNTQGTLYGVPVFTNASVTITAVVVLYHNDSNFVISAPTVVRLNKRGQLGIPIANPTSTYFTEDTTVYLVPADSADTLYYTNDGNNPTTGSTVYNYATGIPLSADSTMLKFYAVNGTATASSIQTEIYQKRDTLVVPVANPASTTFLTDTLVVLTHPITVGVEIRYTVDSSTPNLTSQIFNTGDSILLSGPSMIKAIAVPTVLGKDNPYVQSAVMTETYMPILTVAANPTTQSFSFQQSVALSSNNASAAIYYTLDGSDPDSSVTGSTALYNPAAPLVLSQTTTVKAIAFLGSWKTSAILTEVYTRTSTVSKIELLDILGQPLPNNILYGDATKYTVRLSTNYGGVGGLSPVMLAKNNGDDEVLSLNTQFGTEPGYVRVYRQAYDFTVGGGTDGNGTLESSAYDTLIVTWTNPLDGTDVVKDTLYVVPKDVEAKVYFSRSNSLTDTTSVFTENDKTIYVLVQDQASHPDSSFVISLETATGDSEVVTLTPAGNGFFTSSISVNYDTTKQGNNTLQINYSGEQIQATYVDPLYSTDIKTVPAQFGAKSIMKPYFTGILNGAFFQNDTTVTFASDTPNVVIRYTLDGTDPSFNNGILGTSVSINTTQRIRVIAYLIHDSLNVVESDILEGTFNKRLSTKNPYANPPTTFFTESIQVALVPFDSTDVIYYTLDKSDPDSATSTKYTSLITMTGDTVTVRFYATNGTNIPSAIIQDVYTKRDTLTPPFATPGDSIFFGNLSVTAGHSTVPTAVIRYTLDGSDPDASSFVYPTAGLVFSNPTTLRLRAYGPLTGPDKWVESQVVEYTYQPKVAPPVAVSTPDDTLFFIDLIISLSSPTPGAGVQYLVGSGSNYKTYTSSIRLTHTDSIKAFATRPGWANSDTVTFVFNKKFTASHLSLTDRVGSPLNYLTEENTEFYVRITTANVDLTEANVVAVSLKNGDRDTLKINSLTRIPTGQEIKGRVVFEVGIAVKGNGKISASAFDSIVVSWVNPDDASDSVSAGVRVRPKPVLTSLGFSESRGGSIVSSYSDDVDTVYIVITDQKQHPDSTYEVFITTKPTFGNRQADTLTLPLVEIRAGVMGVAIPVDKKKDTDASDNKLQARKGDWLVAVYKDPVDLDIDGATILYGRVGEIPAVMSFVDEDGKTLPDDSIWSPGADSIFIKYVDDYSFVANGNSKRIRLFVVSTTATGVVIRDTLYLPLSNLVQQDSIGIWNISIPLSETDVADVNDSILQVFFNSEITAVVQSHFNFGGTGPDLTDKLQVANPNEKAEITITDQENDSTVTRLTEKVKIVVKDQNFSKKTDTLLVDVECLRSGDILKGVYLIEVEKGSYERVIDKNELDKVDKGDKALTCQSGDEIKVTYIDPVYINDRATKIVSWVQIVDVKVFFIEVEKDSNSQWKNLGKDWDESDGSHFRIKVEARSENSQKKDVINVTLVSDFGDKLTIKLTETDVFSSVFISDSIPFAFVTSFNKGDKVLDGKLFTLQSGGELIAIAEVSNSQGQDKDTLTIHSSYIAPDYAWMKDEDKDGAGDVVYLKFKDELPRIPASILSIDWPGVEELSAGDINSIHFLVDTTGKKPDTNFTIVVIKADFAKGVTVIDGNNPAVLELPINPVFQNQKVAIRDSMGAVVLIAERKPSSGSYTEKAINDDGDNVYRAEADTLLICLSEGVQQTNNAKGCAWDSLLQFSSADKNGECVERADSVYNLISKECQEPNKVTIENCDGVGYEIIVSNDPKIQRPLGKFCVWLDPDAEFTDVNGNKNVSLEELGVSTENKASVVETSVFTPISYDADTVGIWMPPICYDDEKGTQNLNCYEKCDEYTQDQGEFVDFNVSCASIVQVWSEGGYEAEIFIYDHLGKFIKTWKQSFGKCGELEDERRKHPLGYDSKLIWNTLDQEGKAVGSGVYIWKIRLVGDSNRKVMIKTHKVGVARSNSPDSCWD